MKSLPKIPLKPHFWNLSFSGRFLSACFLFCCLSCGNKEADAPSEEPKLKTESTSNSSGLEEVIEVHQPAAGEKISSPLIVKGKARGSWFFEASAPIQLVSAENEVLAEGSIIAIGNWMTEDFVPFRGQLKFTLPQTEKVYLVLKKANPSGLPERQKEIKISVLLKD